MYVIDPLKCIFSQLAGVLTMVATPLEPVLPRPTRITLFRFLTHVVAPLFYICAAEKDKFKKVTFKQVLCLPQNKIHSVVT